MAKLFARILCPIDFSDKSLAVLDFAARIAPQDGATICLLHVVPSPTGARIGPIPLEPYPVELADSKRRLEQVGVQHLQGKVPYEVVTLLGDPATEIIQAVTDLKIDLVVMATHGRKGLSHLFLGSVAEHVVRGSPKPVLTVRPESLARPARS
jgi:universal stress protein A